MKNMNRNAIAGFACAGTIALAGCGGGGGDAQQPIPTSVTVTIGDVAQSEGQSGKTTFEFVASLSQSHPQTLSVDYTTSDETAQDESGDGDYQASSGTITFAPNTLTSTITVEVNGDAAYELDETFLVTLTNPQGANFSILDGVAKGKIVTDDFGSAADLEVQSVSLMEGDAGQSAFDFTVSLSAPLANDVSVQFTTNAGTAEDEGGDTDFQSANGVLTFASGYTEQHVYVLVFGDTKVEPAETFTVDLFGLTGAGATLLTPQATGTIQNEDAAALVVTDVAALEKDFGAFDVVFQVGLTAEHTELVSVDFATNDGTASSNAFDADFIAQTGTLFFAPGTTELTVTVTGLGDFLGEGDEYFTLDLANESGADLSILDGQATGLLLDNDVDRRIDTDVTGGQSFEPCVAAADGHVYTAWSDDRDGNPDVYFSATDNAGTTWFTNDLRLDTGTPGSAASIGVQVCAEGSNVYVVWQDDRNGQWDVYFNRSTDHGQTWLVNDLRLDDDAGAPASSIAPRIAVASGIVQVVWTDDRHGQMDVFHNVSNDGGATWLPDAARLDVSAFGAPGDSESTDPRLAANGDQVNVAWLEDGRVCSNASFDGGQSWFANHVRVDHPGSNAAARAEDLQLAAQGANVYLAWSDYRNGHADVFFQLSTDGGASFLGIDTRLDDFDPVGLNHSFDPQLSVSGDDVYVVWRDERDDYASAGHGAVYFNHSATGGLTWGGERFVSSGLPRGKADSVQPRVVSDGNDVYVVWADDRTNGNYDLFANVSFDSGQTWLFEPIRLDSDPAGAADSTNPAAVFANDRIQVVWEDARSTLDVYFRSLTFD